LKLLTLPTLLIQGTKLLDAILFCAVKEGERRYCTQIVQVVGESEPHVFLIDEAKKNMAIWLLELILTGNHFDKENFKLSTFISSAFGLGEKINGLA